ncbi:response regulator transcription factor [bacterium]|nr:response regulator transcription factor [bacterium]
MKILVVEDEKEILEFLRKSLEAECYVVDTAEDGEKGSFMARTNEYDLIILDNTMPKKIGQEVCKDVRKDGKNVPILILSVRSETTTKVDLLNAGADDYLTKPFSLDELLARIKALTRRPAKIEDEVLQVEDLVLDAGRHLVKRGEIDIGLTRKEFVLLKYLMKNQGTVLSRSMIMEHVWDMNADPFSNTIESHIVSLRKKVDLEGKKKLIHTINGRGYKMN